MTKLANGFAEFNSVDHVCIEVPDKATTYSFKTSTGQRLTVCFMSDKHSVKDAAPPNMVDICHHDRGTSRLNNRTVVPTFDAVLMRRDNLFDSRGLPGAEKIGLIYIPLETVS